MKLNKIVVINMLIIFGFISSCNSGSSRNNQVNSNSLMPSAIKPQKSLVIKNGEPVRIPEINAMVPFIEVKLSKHHYRLCSGVFISPNKVLTAAHCVMKLHNKISGQYFESKDVLPIDIISIIFPRKPKRPINYYLDIMKKYWSIYHVQTIYVKTDVFTGLNISGKVFSIADYQGINDLAILELRDELLNPPRYKFNMELASVDPQVNEQQMIVGFGHNTGINASDHDQMGGYLGILRIGKTIVSDNTRAEHPSVLRIGRPISNNDLADVVACEGDSGGPSFIYNESSLSYTITGIMSLAYGQSKCSAFPNVYMSVAYYKDWIESGYKTDSLISRDIFLPPLNQANSKISYLASEQN